MSSPFFCCQSSGNTPFVAWRFLHKCTLYILLPRGFFSLFPWANECAPARKRGKPTAFVHVMRMLLLLMPQLSPIDTECNKWNFCCKKV